MSDWDQVTVLKKKPLKAAQMKTESAINQARKFFSHHFNTISNLFSRLNYQEDRDLKLKPIKNVSKIVVAR